MKPKTLMLLAVAGSCGLIAMLGVQQAMSGGQGPKVETAKVLVALENIETGTLLAVESVTFKDVPIDSLPPEEERISTAEQYAERGARIPLFAGDVITLSKLTEPGGTGNSIKIPRGMRVITIPVDESNTQSNLISPGDRVDVLVTFQSRGSRTATTKQKTLLEYVEVFATDARTTEKIKSEETASRTSHVSLLLMPEQVNYVKLAERKGNLSLSWRHKLDDEFVQIQDIDEDLLEELEGTIGINERQPLYGGQGNVAGYESPLFETFEEKEPEVEEPETAIALVEQVEVATIPETAAIPEVVEVAVVEEKPKWTIQVYNGNTPTPHQFEIEAEEKEEATAQAESVNPVAETLRSLLQSN